MRIALFEPDIPQNTGTILRLAACLGIEAHIIEPAGFPISDRAFRRAGMDYLDQVRSMRHASWQAFEAWRRAAGAAAGAVHHACARRPISTTLPPRRRAAVRPRIRRRARRCARGRGRAACVIPMRPGLRSLNVAMAAAMAVGEAMRQVAQPATPPLERRADRANSDPESTRRVKDILTPLGAAPHPPRSLALSLTNRLQYPQASEGDITLPDIPRRQGLAKEWQKSAQWQ